MSESCRKVLEGILGVRYCINKMCKVILGQNIITKLVKPLIGGDRKIILTFDCIAEVILGAETSDTHMLDVIDLCKLKILLVYCNYKVPFEFAIAKKN